MDNVRKWTDKRLHAMERRIADIYAEAEADMSKKWNDYMQRGQKRLAKLQNAYNEALKVGDDKVIAETKQRLEKAKLSFTLQNEHYQKMVNSVTLDMAHVNQLALDYIHGELPDIYAMNYVQANEIIARLDLDFVLPNKNAVKNMILNGDIDTPFMHTKRFINIPKDQRWNTKYINSQVLQGIIQGEDIRKISNRIFPEIMSKTTYKGASQKRIRELNRQAAIRNARTLVTGAENEGKWDSYKALDKRGLVLKKEWIATGDSRTRDAHLALDGKMVDLNEKFTDGNGDELRYPGDPLAEARTVYNCRCALVSHVIGFRMDDGTIRKIDDDEDDFDLHDTEITKEKERRKS